MMDNIVLGDALKIPLRYHGGWKACIFDAENKLIFTGDSHEAAQRIVQVVNDSMCANSLPPPLEVK
jgi:hypothetical protein